MVNFRSGEGFSGKCGTRGGEFLEPAARWRASRDLDGERSQAVWPVKAMSCGGGEREEMGAVERVRFGGARAREVPPSHSSTALQFGFERERRERGTMPLSLCRHFMSGLLGGKNIVFCGYFTKPQL
ncbi:uncharacterized protein A4U43_C10F7650 [Asparagus officinalis]|uniref:Uncharacterized protein n=1 Tax=Asparagus officinalis TaxID=4686 RepID=A0A5P1E326_ASPOF|nr:uncharacterized protein A4U43_C10F7650 [Asparagus officinalis]